MRNVLPIALIAAAAAAQPRDLSVESWLQAPDGFQGTWSALKGKVVVLEFGATWCGPCVAAIPHLNQLAGEFRGRDVVFLSLMDDPMDRMLSFLNKRPMDAIIGIDTKRANWSSFEVPSIPHTFLMGRDGVVIGATLPENVTAAVLREALDGGRPALPPKEGIPSDLDWDRSQVTWQDGVMPETYAIIKPIQTTTSGFIKRPTRLTADGVPLSVLVQAAYETDYHHVDWRAPKDGRMYRAAVQVPEDRKDRLLPYLRATLAEIFAIQTRWEDQERDVWVLRTSGGGPPESRADKEVRMMLKGKITLKKQPVKELCDLLTNSLGLPVVDETGLTARYDFDLTYQPGQRDVTLEALKAIGLEASREKRRIRMLVVE